MEYLTYETYKELGGELPKTAFNRYYFKAKAYIDRETFGRIRKMEQLPEEVKNLVFELIGLNAKADISADKVTNESVGSWSKSYQPITTQEFVNEQQHLISDYLVQVTDDYGTPVLYRGC